MKDELSSDENKCPSLCQYNRVGRREGVLLGQLRSSRGILGRSSHELIRCGVDEARGYSNSAVTDQEQFLPKGDLSR